MPPNPNTSTRAEFTASYLAIAPLPADPSVSAKWTHLVNSLLALIKALGEHEAMQRNNQQTYMTPAKDKNAQYFAWDFVGRTIVGGFSIKLSFCHLHILGGLRGSVALLFSSWWECHTRWSYQKTPHVSFQELYSL